MPTPTPRHVRTKNANMRNLQTTLLLVLILACIYSLGVNGIKKEITKVRNQVHKDRQMLGRSTSFIAKKDSSYFFKIRIERDNGEVLDIPLFQTSTGAPGNDDDDNVLIVLFELQPPQARWPYYRIRREEINGQSWSIGEWGTFEHLENRYALDESVIEFIQGLPFMSDNHGEIKNEKSLSTFTFNTKAGTTKATLMVDVKDGSISYADKGPSL